ncbi:SPOC like C-terminal domain-containing protein [Flagelloscypha sp. PMI_526]|nr:SPOC like C-terminal domain-containing protein [Flagelloscypha sp. PMI_526]
MATFDDWNKLDDDDEEELQDNSFFENKRDVILFCIDCSPSMHVLYDDPDYEDQKTCHLFSALNAAIQIQRKKILSGPNDHVGILLFNTTLKTKVNAGQDSEIKDGTCLYQPIAPLNADTIKETMKLRDKFRRDNNLLEKTMPPMTTGRAAMGDVFTSCNWVIRDGAPKSATKRVFLITDTDDPHPGLKQLLTSSKTTLVDLTQAGVMVEPFFISTEDSPFDPNKFYKDVLSPNQFVDEEGVEATGNSELAASLSITKIDNLLEQMQFREVPKRAHFSIPFELGKDFTIGVKGYGLVTEQKKASYKFFHDRGDKMLMASSDTRFLDDGAKHATTKEKVFYGIDVGKVVPKDEADDAMDEDNEDLRPNARTVERGKRVCSRSSRPTTPADDIKEFRTLGLTPGLKLLGFKNRDQLHFEDNIKHSLFIYPDESTFSGSKRTFSALLKSMVKKDKIAIARGLIRRNATPTFFALLPQEEKPDEGGWTDPAGFHITSDELVEKAAAWIKKLKLKNGGYEPDSYPNPALAFHNAQLEAAAFREPFDPSDFEDLTKPNHDAHHKKAGKLIAEWKEALKEDPSADAVVEPKKTAGTKRKAAPAGDSGFSDAELRERYEGGTLAKLTVNVLKDILRSKALPISGNKGDLIDRLAEWLDAN